MPFLGELFHLLEGGARILLQHGECLELFRLGEAEGTEDAGGSILG